MIRRLTQSSDVFVATLAAIASVDGKLATTVSVTVATSRDRQTESFVEQSLNTRDEPRDRAQPVISISSLKESITPGILSIEEV